MGKGLDSNRAAIVFVVDARCSSGLFSVDSIWIERQKVGGEFTNQPANHWQLEQNIRSNA